jgi:hypothetical protein
METKHQRPNMDIGSIFGGSMKRKEKTFQLFTSLNQDEVQALVVRLASAEIKAYVEHHDRAFRVFVREEFCDVAGKLLAKMQEEEILDTYIVSWSAIKIPGRAGKLDHSLRADIATSIAWEMNHRLRAGIDELSKHYGIRLSVTVSQTKNTS